MSINELEGGAKPRKGCFEVRVAGKEDAVLSLVDMKRPFPALKALDIDALCSDVVAALTSE